MSWGSSDISDLSGRVAIVTGGNGGLGLETARALAGAGATVVIAARNLGKGDTAIAAIRSDHADATLELVELDLASLDSIRRASDTIVERHTVVDLLVNNAGIMGIPEQRTADGFEMQFGTNHLGHFALTAHLLPTLLRADAARVVTVTSTAHHFGRPVDPENPHLAGRYDPWRAYGQAKLANYHFAIGLQRRFEAAGARAQSLLAHPGLSNTDLQSHSVVETGGGRSQRFFERLAKTTGMPADRGALPQLRAAVDPDASGGEFYGPRFVNNGVPVRRPVLRRIGLDDAIETLWEVSERETGVTLDVAATRRDLDAEMMRADPTVDGAAGSDRRLDEQQVIAAHRDAGRMIEVDGMRTFVRTTGAGDAVICLHGVPASSFLYRKLLPQLADHDLRGVAFDLPGLGFADRPETFDYSWTGLGRFVADTIGVLGLDRFHLVVHDIGGPVGFEVAARMPERVASMTMLNTIVDVATFDKPWSMRPFEVPGVGEAWLATTSRPVFRRLMRMQGVADSSVPDAELDAYLGLLLRDDGGSAFLQIMRSFETTPEQQEAYRATLASAEYPIQVVWGELDPALGIDRYGEEARRAAGVDSIHRLPGKHFLQEDQAEPLAHLIAQLAAS